MGIQIENLSKKFGDQQILQNFSLKLPEKGIVCFFGPSGCGKTTLLHLIAGLILPDQGKISGSPKKVSVVFQENRLLPWASAQENVAVVLEDRDTAQAEPWLNRVGLSDAKDKFPAQLSGGMCQRVSLARAMAYDGEVFILDEPFKGLDADSKAHMMNLMLEKTMNRLVLFVTHELEEALQLSNTVYVLDGPPLEIMNRLDLIDGSPGSRSEETLERFRKRLIN